GVVVVGGEEDAVVGTSHQPLGEPFALAEQLELAAIAILAVHAIPAAAEVEPRLARRPVAAGTQPAHGSVEEGGCQGGPRIWRRRGARLKHHEVENAVAGIVAAPDVPGPLVEHA